LESSSSGDREKKIYVEEGYRFPINPDHDREAIMALESAKIKNWRTFSLHTMQ